MLATCLAWGRVISASFSTQISRSILSEKWGQIYLVSSIFSRWIPTEIESFNWIEWRQLISQYSELNGRHFEQWKASILRDIVPKNWGLPRSIGNQKSHVNNSVLDVFPWQENFTDKFAWVWFLGTKQIYPTYANPNLGEFYVRFDFYESYLNDQGQASKCHAWLVFHTKCELFSPFYLQNYSFQRHHTYISISFS